MPKDAEVLWTVFVPDDPTNDDPNMHVEWGAYVDPDDYDAVAVPLGFKGGKNEGDFDHKPRWEAAGGHSLTVVSDAVARTATHPVAGKAQSVLSKVIVHCPNLAGDRLIVRAEIFDPTGKVPSFPDHTGRMTMWNRIDVDYVLLEGADPIPVEEIPPHFEPMCAQLDFTPPRPVKSSKDTMAADDADLANKAFPFGLSVLNGAGRQTNKGWLCLIAAKKAYNEVVKGPTFFAGTVTLTPGKMVGDGDGTSAEQTTDNADCFFYTPDPRSPPPFDPTKPAAPIAASAHFHWKDVRLNPPADVQIRFSVEVKLVGTKVRVMTFGNPHQVIFNAKAPDGPLVEGSLLMSLANRQKFEDGLAWRQGGYGMPANVDVDLHKSGKIERGVTATRPGTKNAAAPVSFVFTKAIADPAESARVAIHELTHAIGLSHRCAYWDYHANRINSCCMTYADQWVFTCSAGQHLDDVHADSLQLKPGTSRRMGRDHCGRHIKEGRRIHLEDHPGLLWG